MSTATVCVEPQKQALAVATLANGMRYRRKSAAEREANLVRWKDPVAWCEERFLIEGPNQEGLPMALAPHQRAILRYIFAPTPDGKPRFTTVVWSCPKKSGKTAIAAMVARWAAETWGRFGEIYCLANDFDQAKSRAYAAISQSIELNPEYNASRRVIPGRWLVQDRVLLCLTSGGKIKALASDYKGEAGANPTLTIWTELWGYVHEASRRLWTEMTPSPARSFSMRWVETYAGFEGESDLLESLYNVGKAGRQLTAGDIGDLTAFAEAPNPDSPIPVWQNDAAGILMYWDSEQQAHRMPWQSGDDGEQYYRQQSSVLLPSEFDRIHLNRWSSGTNEGIAMEWWDACEDPLPLRPDDKTTPLIVAVDASVSGDCTAINVVSRHPDNRDHVVQRWCRAWTPDGGKIDYEATITPVIQWLIESHNVVEVAYDEYQLHHWSNLRRADIKPAWLRPFPQGEPRLLADKGLVDLMRDRRLHHLGDRENRQHVQNCALKVEAKQDSKLRLVKKAQTRKIDLAVSLSMAAFECLRLNL